MTELAPIYAPFAVYRCPQLKMRLPSVSMPSTMGVFAMMFASYFFVTSGIIYDAINEPPAMGVEQDPVTGAQKPSAILRNRINGQYIVEGLSGGFLYCLGGLSFILLDVAADRKRSATARKYMTYSALAMLLVAYNMIVVFLRMKLPGYLS